MTGTSNTAQNQPQVQGGALRVQSLEQSLKVLTSTERNYKLWQEIPKTPAHSTVEEFNTLSQYGNDAGGFNLEGQLPQQDDSTFTRNVALVKFLGTTRQVTHPLSLVKPAHGDVIALENRNGILWILRRMETALFNGDSTVTALNGGSFRPEGPEFNGLQQQIDANNVVDLLGNPISEEVIEEGANQIAGAPNYGTPTHLFLSQRTMADFSKTVYGKERFMPQQASVDSNGQVGYFIQSITTQAGVIGLRPDVFIQNTPPAPNAATAAVTDNQLAQPLTLTGSYVTATPASTGSFYKDGAGTYRYAYTYGNQYGESAVSNSVAVTITDLTSTVTITDYSGSSLCPSGNLNKAQWVGIYRTQPNGVILYRIARKGLTQNTSTGSATFTFVDTDAIMAGTSEAYLGEMSTQVIEFRQLSPLAKMDLAIISPAYRWMILLYGTMILYAPRKWVRYINIGSSSAINTV
ncbi:MAG: hypothetical protein PHN89_05220 [Candidatus Pacebacteria bacterium]|nr:hypothetical protein [Candidatus Paceibacterota bacterium]